MSFNFFKCFFISASYLVAKYHNDFVMHSRDTGPLLNLGPFGPIVSSSDSSSRSSLATKLSYDFTLLYIEAYTYTK